MTKSLQKPKKKKQAIQKVKKFTPEETKEMVRKMTLADCSPDKIIDDMSKLLPEFSGKNRQKDSKYFKEFENKLCKALTLIGLETHYPLAETIGEKFRPLVIEFSNQLIKEYKCQTASEKALAEVIAGAYVRILEYSTKFNCCARITSVSNDINTYYAMLSKEIDRAQRHFITALTTLKQIKAPKLDINVKAKNAFVSQNQQINANQKSNENINP